MIIKRNFRYTCTTATENMHAKFTKNQQDASLLTQTEVLVTEAEAATRKDPPKT
jgi:hypothetical protein